MLGQKNTKPKINNSTHSQHHYAKKKEKLFLTVKWNILHDEKLKRELK